MTLSSRSFFAHFGPSPPAPDLSGVCTVAGDFNESDLSDACDKGEIVADVVKTWMEKGENRPTLCYGVDRKHARHLQERFTEAEPYFQAVLRANPGNAVAHFNLGYTHDKRGQYERAIHDFEHKRLVLARGSHFVEENSCQPLVTRIVEAALKKFGPYQKQ